MHAVNTFEQCPAEVQGFDENLMQHAHDTVSQQVAVLALQGNCQGRHACFLLIDCKGLKNKSFAPVDKRAKVISTAGGGVGGNSRRDALIDAHLDAGPYEDKVLVAPHLSLALR